MPKHRIEIDQPPRMVLNSDVSLVIFSDDAKLGELCISRGTIDWRPANKKRVIKKSWEQFARLMED